MELEGPIKIEVDKLEDTGDDLKEGINAVEASRQLLKQSCHYVSKLRYSIKLK